MEWIGQVFTISLTEMTLVLEVPEIVASSLVNDARDFAAAGMIGLRRLRSFMGVASWTAGIVPRSRWLVSILYATLADCDRDVRSGQEEARRWKRRDPRQKAHLVSTKRI